MDPSAPGASRRRLTLERLEDRALPSSTPPAAPVITATAASDSQINLSWHGSTGASSYLIDELEGSDWVQLASVGGSSRSFHVKGLAAGAEYSFEVGAVNSAGSTFASPLDSTTFPAAPVVAAAASSASEIDLSWVTVPGATAYEVEQNVGGKWKSIASLDGTATVYAVTGLKGGAKYQFRVAAGDAGGESWSSSESAVTFPDAPTVKIADMSGTEIKLSWSGVSGASSYQVYELAGTTFASIITISGKWCIVGGLSYDTSYTFEVAAANASGATISATVTLSTPPPIDPNPFSVISYSPVNLPLFGKSGPSYLDVQQGQVGDCWLIAGLAALADQDPQAIENMFTYDGTEQVGSSTVGVYTVRFYDQNGDAQYVTVNTMLPNGGHYYEATHNGVLWAALAEKAYAAANGEGIVSSLDPDVDSYSALNGGDSSWVFQAVTNDDASYNYTNTSQIAAAWTAGYPVVLATDKPSSSFIVSDHAYAVVGYNASTGNFTLLNPWGGTTTSTACPVDPQKLGLFTASPTFIEDNFTGQFIGPLSASPTANSAEGASFMPLSSPGTTQASTADSRVLTVQPLYLPSEMAAQRHRRAGEDGDWSGAYVD